MKHQIVRTLQKYLLNPPMKLALAVGLPLPGYAILETKRRKHLPSRRLCRPLVLVVLNYLVAFASSFFKFRLV